jgi:hypothetical protein
VLSLSRRLLQESCCRCVLGVALQSRQHRCQGREVLSWARQGLMLLLALVLACLQGTACCPAL